MRDEKRIKKYFIVTIQSRIYKIRLNNRLSEYN